MRIDISKDYFAVLGVSPHADPDVVKAAYRALVKKYHPDRAPDDAEQAAFRFQQVQEAYELLSDEDRLKYYMLARERAQQHHAWQTANRHRPAIHLLLDDRWDHLVREYPDIGRHHARFGFMSRKLAEQFKLIVLGSGNPAGFQRVAARMERQFYRRHFSYHRDLQALARKLAARRMRHLLRDLAREIGGRRLMRPGARREMLERFENRYLRAVRPAPGAWVSGQNCLPRKAPPRPATATPRAARILAWLRPAYAAGRQPLG